MKTDNTQEIKIAAREVVKLYDMTSDLTVTNDSEMRAAADLLAQVKAKSKDLRAKKKAILDPLKKAVDEIKNLFKEPEDQLATAEQIVKDAVLAYHTTQEAAARKEAERIERRLDKGTMKVETGIAKLAGIEQAENNIQTENGSVQFKQGREKVRITDVAKLLEAMPGLLQSERVLEAIRLEVTPAVLASTYGLPGVEVYREKIVAGVAA
jgi:hypothetical protein